MRRYHPESARGPEGPDDVTVPLARPAHGGGINNRQKFAKVFDEKPVKQGDHCGKSERSG